MIYDTNIKKELDDTGMTFNDLNCKVIHLGTNNKLLL